MIIQVLVSAIVKHIQEDPEHFKIIVFCPTSRHAGNEFCVKNYVRIIHPMNLCLQGICAAFLKH